MLVDNFYHIIERAEDKVTIQFNPSHPIYAAHFQAVQLRLVHAL